MELFHDDSLLPEEFNRQISNREKEIEPEKRLMLAVLKDAVWCFQKYLFAPKSSKHECEFRVAKEWIWEEDSEWLFSFNNICETLGLGTAYMRQGLRRWKEEQLSAGRRKIV